VLTIVITTQIIRMETVATKKFAIDTRCQSCFKSTYQHLFEKFNISPAQGLSFLVFFEQCLLTHARLTPPEFQSILNTRFCEIIGIKDPFEKEKIENNITALKLYKEMKPKVKNAINAFDYALRLSIAGNIMDYGANNNFDIHKTIEHVLNSDFAIDKSNLLKENIEKASTILYIGDNAGEIVFDKLFIETCLKGKKVIYAVRGMPVLNDVTLHDAEVVGMHEYAQVISNGHNAPSTVLKACNYEFKKIYNTADLIISKGQGNLEGLISENNKKIFFLLMVKCHVIGELLGVEKGNFVVYNQS